jgi:hypothetical protein
VIHVINQPVSVVDPSYIDSLNITERVSGLAASQPSAEADLQHNELGLGPELGNCS